MSPYAISTSNKIGLMPSKDTKNTPQIAGVLFESDCETVDGGLATDIRPFKKAEKRKLNLLWQNIIRFSLMHLAALYGGWLFCTSAKWATMFFAIFAYTIGMLGITGGAHRLWAHRSYKAKWPLRVILIIFNTIAFQGAAFHWARDHRVHHKFSDTDADPHNATRGLFYSHVGWLLSKKHADVIAKGKSLDLKDLYNDPILMFQRKYYKILVTLACFVLPTIIPMYSWDESFINSWFVPTMFRWCLSLNATWCVNSVAHKFGFRPYDKTINASENSSVAAFTFGEGWHNYHHAFPWDYKTGEWGNYSKNMTTAFIDFFAKIGWAYDLKSVAPETIERRVNRIGDGTHELWGWGDKDLSAEDKNDVVIINGKIN